MGIVLVSSLSVVTHHCGELYAGGAGDCATNDYYSFAADKAMAT
jgi:hypothetical protein